MKKNILIPLALFACRLSFAQSGYQDSLQLYLDKYVKDHEVVKEADKKYIRFFPIDETYRVKAKFERAKENNWFVIPTTGKERKFYRVYGTVSFTLQGTPLKLNLYQAQNLMADPEYKDYLLLLFTDETSGTDSYEGGRYLDFTVKDIKNNELLIDFNKAYNPYCAYEKDKYNCPIPPKENALPVAIKAGEKTYSKQ
jgi:uncharacterized protein